MKLYQPAIDSGDIYVPHPSLAPFLPYNHCVDLVYFKGLYLAAWNANQRTGEGSPEQFNYLSWSEDLEQWSPPVRAFTAEGGAINAVEIDNQWQPAFLNYNNEVLFCAWCSFTRKRVFISQSTDGKQWTNAEVPTAPEGLSGVVGYPTTHGLVTSRGVLMFPCSLPPEEVHGMSQMSPGDTRYAGILLSSDGGKTWEWSEPIEAASWSEIGEDPKEFGGETVHPWEPTLYEIGDNRIGLLIRNSTSQEYRATRADKPHRMVLAAESEDGGRHWSKARPIEVDSVCTRSFALSGVRSPHDLLMVMNDWHVRIPHRDYEHIGGERYFLSLYVAPVCEPDLLLPGPVIQPPGGRAHYPNGFVREGKLYCGYTYSHHEDPSSANSMNFSVVHDLPDFSEPFLLPRGGRSGCEIKNGIASLQQRYSSLGVVLTEALTRQEQLDFSFQIRVDRYFGDEFPLLTLGGKTKKGLVVSARYDADEKTDVFMVAMAGGSEAAIKIGVFRLREWISFKITLGKGVVSLSVNEGGSTKFDAEILRKISFGGLYEPPEWPMGVTGASEIKIDLDSIALR